MSLWTRLFGGRGGAGGAEPAQAAPEHAVILHIPLAETWPSDEEQQRYRALQDELTAAIDRAAAGMLDGDEWGGGECSVYMYGPDAERLWAAIEPVLARAPFPEGSHAIKRFGGPGEGREERIRIEWPG